MVDPFDAGVLLVPFVDAVGAAVLWLVVGDFVLIVGELVLFGFALVVPVGLEVDGNVVDDTLLGLGCVVLVTFLVVGKLPVTVSGGGLNIIHSELTLQINCSIKCGAFSAGCDLQNSVTLRPIFKLL